MNNYSEKKSKKKDERGGEERSTTDRYLEKEEEEDWRGLGNREEPASYVVTAYLPDYSCTIYAYAEANYYYTVAACGLRSSFHFYSMHKEEEEKRIPLCFLSAN